MAELIGRAVDPSGNPMPPGTLVTTNTANAADWGKPGITLNPNPRPVGADGRVNLYTGGPIVAFRPDLPEGISVQLTCQNGTVIDPAGGFDRRYDFDGTKDVLIQVTAVPFVDAPGLPFLEQRGKDFVDAQGNRDFISGCDGFLDYRIWLDQGQAGLAPFMEESQAIGFRARRVFLAGSAAQNGVLNLYPQHEPRFYAELVPFVSYQNAHGIVPLLTWGVDMQDVMPIDPHNPEPGKAQRREHWERFNATLAGCGLKYLVSGWNQWSKNGGNDGYGPWDLTDPGSGVIWSRGSDIDDTKTDPKGAPAGELHSTRVSWDRSLMDTTASPINMRQHGYGMCWMTEGIPFDADSDPEYGRTLGAGYAVDWALAIFHNRQGQRGQLLQPGTRACAEAWQQGMRIS